MSKIFLLKHKAAHHCNKPWYSRVGKEPALSKQNYTGSSPTPGTIELECQKGLCSLWCLSLFFTPLKWGVTQATNLQQRGLW